MERDVDDQDHTDAREAEITRLNEENKMLKKEIARLEEEIAKVKQPRVHSGSVEEGN